MAEEDAARKVHDEFGHAEPETAGKRERSAIKFPYLSLEEAVVIAKGIHEVGGNTCEKDQLAAHLSVKPDTGAFRVRLGTAKTFGLITYSGATVTLTNLGSRICDPQQEQAAKAEAFLTIPLYRKVYEQFKGVNLPQLAALETAMVTMGVSPKQKDTARQVFQRSAQYSGFFWSGPGRLVYPRVKANAAGSSTASMDQALTGDEVAGDGEKPPRGSGGGGGGGDGRHPLIDGLIKTLEKLPDKWPIEARRKWLQTASNIFDMAYPNDDGRSLRVEIEKESAQ